MHFYGLILQSKFQAQKSLMLNSSRGAIVTAFSILKSSCRLGPDAEGCGFCFSK
ncbi:hypothetical protein RchiOBHm_Chr7g0192241 [Rosa chinensis]|uniref:Uncharacterized protein n=1 Tax=Rosa chinensis TaxID=74649 RepID=A0A2P6P5H2_ROSCH|nr:hypothetical protein RchiOBHm_Chr7g0192241 [Rosa chinensis]